MAAQYPTSFVGAPAVTGANLGSTVGRIGPFSAKVGDDLQFKTLVAGAGVSLVETSTEIAFTAPRTNVALTSAGGTQTLVAVSTGPAMQTKGLTAGAGTTLSSTATAVTIANTTQVNTASNLGSGAQAFSAKVGADLRFRSVTAGTGVTVTQDSPSAGNITITPTSQLLNMPWVFWETLASGTTPAYTFPVGGGTVTRLLNATGSGSNPSTDVQLAVAPASTNQLRIVTGVYLVNAWSGGTAVDGHQAYLWNVTNSVTEILGSTEHGRTAAFTNASNTSTGLSVISGVLTVTSGPKVYELRHRCNATAVVDATQCGQPLSAAGRVERYAMISLMKIT